MNQFARRSISERQEAHKADPHKYERWRPERCVRLSNERGDVSLPRIKFVEGGADASRYAKSARPSGGDMEDRET